MIENGKSTLERHFQSVVQVALIAIILWFGNKTTSTSDAVIRLEGLVATQAVQLEALRVDLTVMRGELIGQSSQRYRKEDADNESRLNALQHKIFSNRLDALASRLSALERMEAAEHGSQNYDSN